MPTPKTFDDFGATSFEDEMDRWVDDSFDGELADEEMDDSCPDCGAPPGEPCDPSCPNADAPETVRDPDVAWDTRHEGAVTESFGFDKFMDVTVLRESRAQGAAAKEVHPQRQLQRGYQEHPLGKIKVRG